MKTAREVPLVGGPEFLDTIRVNPLATLESQVAKHGDIFGYGAEDGPAILINDPEMVRHVLVTHSDRYTKVGTPEMDMLRPVLGNGLMTVEGTEWRHQRDLGVPHFREERLAAYLPVMGAEIEALFERWAVDPRAVGLNDPLSGLTLCMVTRCLFESKLSFSETDDVGTGVGALNEFMISGIHSDVEGYDRRRRAMTKMSAIVWSIVQTGRISLTGATPKSLLETILRTTVAEGGADEPVTSLHGAVDQVITYLMAGHETTAKALTWALYLLSSRPECQDCLAVEIAEADARASPGTTEWLKNLPKTESLLLEVMRLYPPVWMISRRAAMDDEIEGWRVQQASLVALSPYLLHRHRNFWDEPETFRAERFLKGSGDATKECRYLPFGAGQRNCIGRRFAMYEMMLFLAKFLAHFRVTRCMPETVIPQALVTLRPETDIAIWIEPRK